MTELRAEVQRLYERHYLPLVRLAAHLVDDLESAEDVVQDVFAGLRTAVINRARSVLRRRRVVRAFGARASVVDFADPADEDVLRADRRSRILAAIAQLPTRQKEVVVLRYYEDLGVGEIAELLRISPGAVSSSLSRALDALQTRLGDDREH